MKLDIVGLPSGHLVNNEGNTSSRSKDTGLYYCGMKVLVGVKGTDGHCGPIFGPNCKACKVLQVQTFARYYGIVNA